MKLNEIVASYMAKEDKAVNVDLGSLSNDDDFNRQVFVAILEKLKGKPQACVYLPSYQQKNKNLGPLINKLATSLRVKTLVTGSFENLKRIRGAGKKEVVFIKQSFRSGSELARQVAAIKKTGSNVSVICLISHSRAKLERFAKENDIEVSALVYCDEM